MVSLKDVALASGFSKSTVSRCINNNPSISKRTRDLVMLEVKRLNYVPNLIAKSLSNNNSYTVTLLVDVEDEKSFQNPFFYAVIHGIEKVVYDKEYCLVVANINSVMKEQNIIDWLIKGKRTEGLILPSSIINDELIRSLKKYGVPFVIIGDPDILHETVSWVDVNNRRGGEQAALRLIDAGYKNISIMGYDEQKVFSKQRIEGYRKALSRSGHIIDESLIKKGQGNNKDGYIVMKELLESNNKPDAVICSKEFMSIGAIRAIQEKGLRIPEDIGIISFDNNQIAELAYPAVSTVKVDLFELGLQASELLFEYINKTDRTAQQLMIPTSLDERETVK